MALTNGEKADLRDEIMDYLNKGYPKKKAVIELMNEGFKKSTINKYWKTFSGKTN